MPDIDNLSIRIGSSADNASKAIDRVGRSLRGVKAPAHAATDALRHTNDVMGKTGDEAKSTADKIKSASAPLTALKSRLMGVASAALKAGKGAATIPRVLGGQFVKSIGQSVSGLGSFLTSIKRIAMYRLIRTAIKEITQGFSEGIKNLYGWSAMVNGTFAPAMDRIATATQYLHNSLGAMASPLIEALAPAIDFVIDRFVELINVVNQLFARLTGRSTYTAARKVAAEWDDSAKSVKGSVAEMRRTILGFDEINRLDKNRDSGSGSGSKKQTDYSGMFETRAITSGVMNFADELSAAFKAQDWKKLGQTIGSKINQAVDMVKWGEIGGKIGTYINGWFTTKYWTLDTINFTNIGKSIASFLNKGLAAIDFETIGRTLVQKYTVIIDTIIGFFTNFDWKQFASALSNFVIGMYEEITKWLRKYDWTKLGSTLYEKVKDALSGIKWAEVAQAFMSFLGTAILSIVQLGIGFIGSFWADVANWWNENIKADTFSQTAANILSAIGQGFLDIGAWVYKNLILPFLNALGIDEQTINAFMAAGAAWLANILKGILNGLQNISNWLFTNVCLPIIDGLLSIFGPAHAEEIQEPGENIGNAILAGIKSVFTNITEWVKTNIFQPIVNAVATLGKIVIGIGVALLNTALDIWGWIKAGWDKLVDKVLDVGVVIATSAVALWGTVKRSWASLMKGKDKVLGLVAELKNTASDWWDNAKGWWSEHIEGKSLAEIVAPLADTAKDWWSNAQTWWSEAIKGKWLSDVYTELYNGAAGWWYSAATWWNQAKGWLSELYVGVANTAWMWWRDVQNWWNQVKQTLTLTLSIEFPSPASFANSWNKAGGLQGIINAFTGRGGTGNSLGFASGGFVNGNVAHHWGIPAYAGGTNRAHGSLFLAGEAGPEIVGHIGGRTEVLNKSQLAMTMFEAVHSAMTGISFDLNAGNDGGGDAPDALFDTIMMAVQTAIANNPIDRERNDILRRLEGKELTAEVTAADIARAQQRYNRRAGTTVSPVGT